MEQALEVCGNLFYLLSLALTKIYYPLEFWDYGNPEKQLDIDEILEDIAIKSVWISPDSFIDLNSEYEKLSESDKALLDKWRAKLGK